MAQMVKHLPTMRETWVQLLGREDLLEKETATPSSILTWKIPWAEEPRRIQSMGVTKSRTRPSDFTLQNFGQRSLEQTESRRSLLLPVNLMSSPLINGSTIELYETMFSETVECYTTSIIVLLLQIRKHFLVILDILQMLLCFFCKISVGSTGYVDPPL